MKKGFACTKSQVRFRSQRLARSTKMIRFERGAAPARLFPEGWASPEALVGVHFAGLLSRGRPLRTPVPSRSRRRIRTESILALGAHGTRGVLSSKRGLRRFIVAPAASLLFFFFFFLSLVFEQSRLRQCLLGTRREGCVAEATRTAFENRKARARCLSAVCALPRGHL